MDDRDVDSQKMVPAVHCEVIQALETNGTINVFVICLDRVGHNQNIIDRGFGLQFACAISHANKQALDGEIHLLVICSAKKGSFLAGADILSELKYIGGNGSESVFEDCLKLVHILCALESLPVPTIAVLNGTTLGGGLELALACDYRVADESCTQIGLPEVKLGVLPGVGGCVRLPRLVGVKPALDLLLTGNSISARQACATGLVDLLMSNTETVASHLGDEKCSYNYKWLAGILSLVDRKAIGKRELLVRCSPSDLIAMDTIDVYEQVKRGNVEEELTKEMNEGWREYEYKASNKFPPQRTSIHQVLSYVASMFFYILALVQLWRTIGMKFPAPYICLLTTYQCLSAKSWKESMVLNCLGFSLLATSAESKGLMSLFLHLRKLKRLALHFGLKQKEDPPPVSKSVVVLISDKALAFSSTFIQSLLYSGFEVRVIDVSEKLTKLRVEGLVRKYFDYSIRRGRMTEEQVDDKLSRLLFNHGSDVESMGFDDDGPLCVADCCVNDERTGEVIRALQNQVTQVVCVSTVPHQARGGDNVLVNLGDPLRKNTTGVEITPASHKVPAAHISHVASLIVALGKLPVLTPPTPLPQASLYLTLTHWALAVSLTTAKFSGGKLNEKKLDSILCNEGGYTKGPFAILRELDPVYLNQMVTDGQLSTVVHLELLKSFLLTGKLPTQQPISGSTPPRLSASDIVEFTKLSLGLAALYVRKLTPDISEAAIDVLAVSGLVHFPPSEGGPFNYLARVGQSQARRRLSDLSRALPAETVRSVMENFTSVMEGDAIDQLFVKSGPVSSASDYERLRGKTLLLTNSELMEVGRTGRVGKREVFTYPLPFILATVLVVLLALSTICVSVYYIL